jgi:methionyl-tRNA formyltransferase
MRFAITGIDRYLGIFESLIRAGWDPVKLFTVPVRPNTRDTNHGMIACAEQHDAAIQMSRITDADMEALREDGCEVLVVASYKWRIGAWQDYLPYAVNFHCSPLPEGRGPYPSVQAILEQRRSWAITCHKVTAKFDRGDILAAEDFPMAPDECHETLDLKIQIAARRLATTVATDFRRLWDAARPQGPGTFWKLWTPHDRVLDFDQPVADILRRVRAFGLIETLAFVNGRWLAIHRAVGWTEAHGPRPGTVVHVNNRTIVIAARDGHIGLIEWEFADDDTVARLIKPV